MPEEEKFHIQKTTFDALHEQRAYMNVFKNCDWALLSKYSRTVATLSVYKMLRGTSSWLVSALHRLSQRRPVSQTIFAYHGYDWIIIIFQSSITADVSRTISDKSSSNQKTHEVLWILCSSERAQQRTEAIWSTRHKKQFLHINGYVITIHIGLQRTHFVTKFNTFRTQMGFIGNPFSMINNRMIQMKCA